jgi:hypothetical protein
MKTYCNDGTGFSVLLNAIMSSFPSAHVSAFAEAYPNLIREVLHFVADVVLINNSFPCVHSDILLSIPQSD